MIWKHDFRGLFKLWDARILLLESRISGNFCKTRWPYLKPSYWHQRACWLKPDQWEAAVWAFPEVCFASGRLSLMDMLQQALAISMGNSRYSGCLMVVLDEECARSPGKLSSKAEGYAEVSKCTNPLRLWIQALSEKHKCLIPRE